MTDFHTHILPAVDDGSKNISDSVKFLHSLEELGFKDVVLTPHFYPQKETAERMLERRDGSFVLLKEKDDSGVKIHLGSECYMHEYLFHAEDLTPFCIDGGRYLLTELAYDGGAGERMLDMIRKLCAKYNVIPILAHIERYPYIMKSEKMLDDFLEEGCLCQTNADVFLNPFVRGKMLKYLKSGYVSFLGTDTHRSVMSESKFKKAKAFIENNLGKNIEDVFWNIGEITNVK